MYLDTVVYLLNIKKMVITKDIEQQANYYAFSDILITKNGYLIVGQTSSKELGGNNKDLISYFLKYDKNGKIVK